MQIRFKKKPLKFIIYQFFSNKAWVLLSQKHLPPPYPKNVKSFMDVDTNIRNVQVTNYKLQVTSALLYWLLHHKLFDLFSRFFHTNNVLSLIISKVYRKWKSRNNTLMQSVSPPNIYQICVEWPAENWQYNYASQCCLYFDFSFILKIILSWNSKKWSVTVYC